MSDEITYFVPTRGRTHRDLSALKHLDAAGLRPETVILCSAAEVLHYSRAGWRVLPESIKNRGIGDARAQMLEECETSLMLMIDDDVSFAVRDGFDSTDPGLRVPAWLRKELRDRVLELFKDKPVVGVGSRLFFQSRPFLTENKQTGWAWGYRVADVRPTLRRIYGRLQLLEDVDWCLTLLEDGIPNVISNYLLASSSKVGQRPEDGGCAIYRTPEMVADQVTKFQRYHPHTVKVVAPRRGNLGEATQYRQRILWSRALGAGVECQNEECGVCHVCQKPHLTSRHEE